MAVQSTIEFQLPGQRRSVEFRVHERHPCQLQTSCQPIAARSDKDLMWPATVRDLSVRGLGLVLGRRFEPGTGLAIEVPGPDGAPSDTLLVKVVHASRLAGGSHLLGCVFVSDLSEDELHNLLELAHAQRDESVDPAGPLPDAEQPTALSAEEACPRTILIQNDPEPPTSRLKLVSDPVSGTSRTVVLPGINFEGKTTGGKAAAVPIRSLILSGPWPLPPGTVLRVRIANRPDTASAVKIRINSCSMRSDRWVVDYSFVDQPTAAMLQELGYRG